MIWGVVNYLDPFSLVHNGEAIPEVPDDFYMTDFISDKSVELIGRFHKDEKPFFLYVAQSATLAPNESGKSKGNGGHLAGMV